jgi:hypothetical protein
MKIHKIYAKAYYSAHLAWDWAKVNHKKADAEHWSNIKNWISSRMHKAGKLGMLNEATRSLD